MKKKAKDNANLCFAHEGFFIWNVNFMVFMFSLYCLGFRKSTHSYGCVYTYSIYLNIYFHNKQYKLKGTYMVYICWLIQLHIHWYSCMMADGMSELWVATGWLATAKSRLANTDSIRSPLLLPSPLT